VFKSTKSLRHVDLSDTQCFGKVYDHIILIGNSIIYPLLRIRYFFSAVSLISYTFLLCHYLDNIEVFKSVHNINLFVRLNYQKRKFPCECIHNGAGDIKAFEGTIDIIAIDLSKTKCSGGNQYIIHQSHGQSISDFFAFR
jgi:hypothetical protein